MNKDEILAASDEQLNEGCASAIMGWEKNLLFDTWTDNPAPLYMNYEGRILQGKSYHVDYALKKGIYSHEWSEYHPTTDIAQAIGLLDHLHATKTLDDWGIIRFPKYYICSITCPHPSIPKQILPINHAHKEMCRAIVFACLLMVAEMDEQQTAAAGDAAREGAGWE